MDTFRWVRRGSGSWDLTNPDGGKVAMIWDSLSDTPALAVIIEPDGSRCYTEARDLEDAANVAVASLRALWGKINDPILLPEEE